MPILTSSELDGFINIIDGVENNKDDGGDESPRKGNGVFYPAEYYKNRYPGDKAYGGLPKDVKPQKMQCTWFHYFTMSENCELRFMTFEASGEEEVSDEQIREWIEEGRSFDTCTNKDITNISWNMPGYVIFCVDIPHWELLENVPKGQTGNRALYFAKIDGAEGESGLRAYPNFSFYNAKTRRIALGIERLQVTQVENHHFNAVTDTNSPDKYKPRIRDGNGNPEEADAYKFDLYFLAKVEQNEFDANDIEDKYAVFVLDPGGKNTGP